MLCIVLCPNATPEKNEICAFYPTLRLAALANQFIVHYMHCIFTLELAYCCFVFLET